MKECFVGGGWAGKKKKKSNGDGEWEARGCEKVLNLENELSLCSTFGFCFKQLGIKLPQTSF